MKKVVIIGGGPAGMMAAYGVAQASIEHEVVIIEQNEKLGKKLYITGKGRCNVTNASDLETVFDHIITNPKFLYSALYTFDNQRVMDFFEENGCKLKVERGNRVFPVSDHSSDIIKTFQNVLKQLGVKVQYNSCVKKLLTKKNQVIGVVVEQNHKLVELMADQVIVATGGISYPVTGSTGDGFKWAKEVGHTVTELKPSLVPFHVKEEWCKELQGLSLKNVTTQLFVNGKRVYEEMGEMLFTHFGVSGPLVISASSYYGKQKKVDEAKLLIDLKPALSKEQLDKRILREFESSQNKQFKNAIGSLYPSKMTPIMIQLSEINPNKKVHEITREERMNLVELTKGLCLHITGTRGYSEAIITKGGIATKEINPSTMESKLIEGLYFAGEILDSDALTGGYNLQIAWSTGYLAGNSIIEQN